MSVKKIIFSLFALTTVGTCFLGVTPAASAFTFSASGDSVTIGANDINQSFDIIFDGNSDTKNVNGLSSKATFKFLGFTQLSGKTEAKFDITLFNTSSGGITSRTSALGFNVDKPLLGVGSTGGSSSGNTRVSGIFGNDRSGSFPNQFGNVDVCFTDGNNCQGGSNGGVTTGNFGVFSPILAFNGSVNSFTLSNLGVRYQSINGNGFNGASGTGKGLYQAPPAPPEPKKVPEPGTIAALGLFAVGVLGLTKKSQQVVTL
ncbi:cistern family PEP-CTERM protein [Iningainema tapete]|uniref:Cistern family PEP-CTERM protein n=1 Tax=Iningainema tapete BLCC-T55 TaxID=2748662 RepID=A0A8J7CI86_9CYAN|nr:cistern family PEP-CTERM protein [Iningainema tapete]MBD2778725.1 cistern family PEP-CTERM protein [Iningainema tapete BLCC-T55]